MENFIFILTEQKKGISLISKNDTYLSRMQLHEPLIKTNNKITKEDFPSFLKTCICEWSDEDKKRIIPILDELTATLSSLKMINPSTINLVKTNGKEEWNSAYTRENTIFLPEKKLNKYDDLRLKKLLIHEFFHIYSRYNQDIREGLYNLLGYYKITEPIIPDNILKRKLTNPDAPILDFAIEINNNNHILKVIPIDFLNEGYETVDSLQDILQSIHLEFLAVENINSEYRAIIKNNLPVLIMPDKKLNFHPEEYFAEIFTSFISDDFEKIPENIKSYIENNLF